VFQHFHAGHHIEAGGLFRGQVFRGDQPVIELHAAFQLVQLGHFEGLVGEVDAGDKGAFDGHAFGQDAAATTDIHHPFALDGGLVVYPFETQGVDVVQGLEFGLGIQFSLVGVGHENLFESLGEFGPGLSCTRRLCATRRFPCLRNGDGKALPVRR